MTDDNHAKLIEAALSESVIGAFYEVYDELGFGFREYIYALAMERALLAKGHKVAREVGTMVYFRGEPLAKESMDMVVDDKLLVENKAREHLRADSTSQLFGYLTNTDFELGLLLHFGRQAKFYRVVCENRFKRRNAKPHDPA